jgi:hypothetical protein
VTQLARGQFVNKLHLPNNPTLGESGLQILVNTPKTKSPDLMDFNMVTSWCLFLLSGVFY